MMTAITVIRHVSMLNGLEPSMIMLILNPPAATAMPEAVVASITSRYGNQVVGDVYRPGFMIWFLLFLYWVF